MTQASQENRLDVSMLAGTNGEFVTDGEVQTLHDNAMAILNASKVRSTVNGAEADVSEVYTEVFDGQQARYARIFHYTKKGMKDAGLEGEDPLFGLVLDDDASPTVFTDNARQIRYTSMAGRPVVVVDSGYLEPRVNNRNDFAILRSAQNNMTRSIEGYRSQLQDEADRARAEKAARRGRIARTAGRFVSRAAVVVAAAAGIGAAGYGAVRGIDWLASRPTYDDKEVPIPAGGNVVRLGESGPEAPGFSEDLIDNEAYGEEMPTLDPVEDEEHEPLHADQLLRDVVLTSSEEGKNCAVVPIEGQTLTDRVIAWTDFVDEEGRSRADELSVDLNFGNVEVCFIGEETDDLDDPRVVLKLVDESDPLARE